MSWIEALRDYIETNELGVSGVDLFIGTMEDLDQPGPVIGLGRYKGRTFETMGSTGIEEPMLQVAVRAPSYNAASDRIDAVRELLRHVGNRTISGFHFIQVMPDGTPKDLQRDTKGRQQFTADFEVWY